MSSFSSTLSGTKSTSSNVLVPGDTVSIIVQEDVEIDALLCRWDDGILMAVAADSTRFLLDSTDGVMICTKASVDSVFDAQQEYVYVLKNSKDEDTKEETTGSDASVRVAEVPVAASDPCPVSLAMKQSITYHGSASASRSSFEVYRRRNNPDSN